MNQLYHKYSEDQILDASLNYLKEKLNWVVPPIEKYIDEGSILLIFEKNVGEIATDSIHDKGIYATVARGKNLKYAWIEFEECEGLKKYIRIQSLSRLA